MTMMTEQREKVRKAIEEAASPKDVVKVCTELIKEAFEDKSTPATVPGVTLMEVERAIDGLMDQDLPDDTVTEVNTLLDLTREYTVTCKDEDRPGSKEDDRDLLRLSVIAADNVLAKVGDPETKATLVNSLVAQLTTATDRMMIDEDCTEEDEAFCDEIMAECARLRRAAMRLQDEVNEKEGYLDSTLFRGYDAKKTEFKKFI